ncbi:MAG: hypothetical protein JWQ11_3146 [Rhizobacter sp.]|nr:hypothetical protein [Rhizobacter sp.]
MSTPLASPIVFLDIDDVLCLNAPYSGFDVIDVFRGRRSDRGDVLANSFSPEPKAALRRLHEALGGNVRYVVSSSWRLYVSRAQFDELLRANGVGFVADHLEPQARWATSEMFVKGARAAEIMAWLRTHGESEPYVVLDDRVSGEGLYDDAAHDEQTRAFLDRVVLCEEGVGLTNAEVDMAIQILIGSRANGCSSKPCDKL